MNTGVQRSGATPPAARTATTQAVGEEPGAPWGQGKSAPLIALAHEIPYVATATIADLRDLEAKVQHAMSAPRRPLHPHPRHLPAGLGQRLAGLDPDRPAGHRDRHLPRVRGRARRHHQRHPDPSARAGRGVPQAPAPLRAPVLADASGRRDRPDPGPGRPQHRALRAARRASPPTPAHGRRAALMEKPFAITLDVGSSRANQTGSWRTERPVYVHRRAPCGARCPAGEDVQALAVPCRGGRLRDGLATDHAAEPAARRDGSCLLPPVRDGVQPRRARRGGRHQLGRALPRRRGNPLRLDTGSRGGQLRAPGAGGRARGPRDSRRPITSPVSDIT